MASLRTFAKGHGGLLVGLLAWMAVGCGGGSSMSASNPGDGGGSQTPAIQSTATFNVNVATGQVTVTPSSVASNSAKVGHLGPDAVFLGNTMGFTSSDILSDSGVTTGVKTIQVKVTNNFSLPIGVDANGNAVGFKVVFSPITNLSAPVNLAPLTNVATYAGSGTSGNANGARLSATFTSPLATTTNSSTGAVYVSDTSGLVRQIQSGAVTTLAGGGATVGQDGLGATANFGQPTGIAVDSYDGSLIVADFTLNKIRRISPTGLVTTIAGTGTSGGANGLGNVATFNHPAGVVVDSQYNIYVSENGGNRIRKLSYSYGDASLATSYSVTTLAGTGTAGSVDGPSLGASFNSPYQIALLGNSVASGSVLVVADSGNNKIRMVDLVDGNVTTIAGTGTAGNVDGSGATATLDAPRGVTAYNGALYIADNTPGSVRQLSLSAGAPATVAANWTVQTLAGSTVGATNGTGSTATFDAPTMLCATQSGQLLVADTGNHTIRQVSPSAGTFPLGTPTGSASTAPVQLANPDGYNAGIAAGADLPFISVSSELAPGQTSAARLISFNVPTGVTAFTFTVTVVAATPVPVPPDSSSGAGSNQAYVDTVAGISGTAGHNNGPYAAATFSGDGYSAIDAVGDIFLADTANNEVRCISGGSVFTIAGNWTATGEVNGTGDVATFHAPVGIAVTPDGQTVFVADQGGNTIRIIRLAQPVIIVGQATVPIDPTNPTNWTVSTIIGNGTAGGNYSADTAGNLAEINGPAGLAYSAAGQTLYFTEFAGNRVRKATFRGGVMSVASDWIVSIVAGDTSAVIGVPALTNGMGTAARFDHPAGLALDETGSICIGDQSNHAIRRITQGGVVSTLAGSGSAGYADGTGASAIFRFPSGVAVDAAGNVYVADTGNDRVRVVTPAGVVTTVAGNGTAGHVDGPGASAEFNYPTGLAVTSDDTLYVGCSAEDTLRGITRSFSTTTQSP